MAINLPVGFCGQFRLVERATGMISKDEGEDGSCTVSEGHGFLQPYIDNVWHE